MEIFAVDIADSSLLVARKGTYQPQQLKNLSNNQVRKYFTEGSDGKFTVKNELK